MSRTEAVSEAQAATLRLADSLVHELRTPLAIVRTELFNLKAADPSLDLGRAMDGCDRIAARLKGLSSLVHRTPSLSRVRTAAIWEALQGTPWQYACTGSEVTTDPGLLAEAVAYLRSAFAQAFPKHASEGLALREAGGRIGLVSPVEIPIRTIHATSFFWGPPIELRILDAVLADLACSRANGIIVFEPPNEISIELREE